MKVQYKLLATFALAITVNYSAFGQWQTNGNNVLVGQFLGSINNQPINIFTNNIQRAQFTTGNAVVEKFRLFVPKDTTNVFLQAQRATGNLSFNTVGGSNGSFPDTKLRIFPDDIDRFVAFENPFHGRGLPS